MSPAERTRKIEDALVEVENDLDSLVDYVERRIGELEDRIKDLENGYREPRGPRKI